MDRITDDDLFNLLDNETDEVTRKKIQQLLQEDQNLAGRMRELQLIHSVLSSKNKIEHPSKSFTDKVMGTLHKKSVPFFISPRNGLLLLAGILVASGLTLTLLSSGTFDQLHTLFNIESIPVKTNLIKIPTAFPFDLKIFLKLFLGINLVIGFILLDRTILRPIFQKRLERLA
jgi:hypothetical protein